MLLLNLNFIVTEIIKSHKNFTASPQKPLRDRYNISPENLFEAPNRALKPDLYRRIF